MPARHLAAAAAACASLVAGAPTPHVCHGHARVRTLPEAIGRRRRGVVLSTLAAARRAGVSSRRIWDALRTGELTPIVIGGKWFVDRDELDRLWEPVDTESPQNARKTEAEKPEKVRAIVREEVKPKETEGGNQKAVGARFPAVNTAASPELEPDAEPKRKYISRRQAAAKVGVHPDTIDNWHSRPGGFGYYRIPGGTIRIDEAEFDRWVEEHRE